MDGLALNLVLFAGSVALGWFGSYLFRSRQAVLVAELTSSRLVSEDAGSDLEILVSSRVLSNPYLAEVMLAHVGGPDLSSANFDSSEPWITLDLGVPVVHVVETVTLASRQGSVLPRLLPSVRSHGMSLRYHATPLKRKRAWRVRVITEGRPVRHQWDANYLVSARFSTRERRLRTQALKSAIVGALGVALFFVTGYSFDAVAGPDPSRIENTGEAIFITLLFVSMAMAGIAIMLAAHRLDQLWAATKAAVASQSRATRLRSRLENLLGVGDPETLPVGNLRHDQKGRAQVESPGTPVDSSDSKDST